MILSIRVQRSGHDARIYLSLSSGWGRIFSARLYFGQRYSMITASDSVLESVHGYSGDPANFHFYLLSV